MTLQQAQDRPSRADYDYRALGRKLRPALERDGRGWRACADEIGVTPSDLSRISAGQACAAHKVIAICDWLKVDLREFYTSLHGKRTETGRSSASRAAGAPAGRAIRRDGPLALPPLAELSDD